MIWENKIPSQQKPTPLDRLDNRPFMTEVGGLFSQVEPEKIARGLCLSVNYACTSGYRQNSRRHEPTRESSLGAHVRMLNRITTEKVPAALGD